MVSAQKRRLSSLPIQQSPALYTAEKIFVSAGADKKAHNRNFDEALNHLAGDFSRIASGPSTTL
jgi:hypothetical protein